MNDWGYAQHDPAEQLARMHYFSMKKIQPEGDIEFLITVKEFFTPKDPALIFFAQADKHTNQHIAPYLPSGWGKTLLGALQECIREINRFPYSEVNSAAAVPRTETTG
ncbi:MAG: hypothetical protein C5B51_06950 [Terriglobia bacterium]|nr:MAG: hypothetical protein C5B51_06950 [Terriglobia bacterium]